MTHEPSSARCMSGFFAGESRVPVSTRKSMTSSIGVWNSGPASGRGQTRDSTSRRGVANETPRSRVV